MRLAGYFRTFFHRHALPIAAYGVFSAFYLSACPVSYGLRGISGILSVDLPSQLQLAGHFRYFFIVMPSRLRFAGHFRHFICQLALSVTARGVFRAFFYRHALSIAVCGAFRTFFHRHALPIVNCGAFSAFYLSACPLSYSLQGIAGILFVSLPSQLQFAGHFRHFVCRHTLFA